MPLALYAAKGTPREVRERHIVVALVVIALVTLLAELGAARRRAPLPAGASEEHESRSSVVPGALGSSSSSGRERFAVAARASGDLDPAELVQRSTESAQFGIGSVPQDQRLPAEMAGSFRRPPAHLWELLNRALEHHDVLVVEEHLHAGGVLQQLDVGLVLLRIEHEEAVPADGPPPVHAHLNPVVDEP